MHAAEACTRTPIARICIVSYALLGSHPIRKSEHDN